MKNNKEYILEKAFEQYLLNGHEGVSISVLQESLNIGRATLYYYFQSKENLFKQVIEKYFFDIVIEGQKKINGNKITVPELIELFLGLYQQIKENLLNTNLQHVSFSNFTALILHAYTHYTDIAQKMDEIKNKIFSAWQYSICNSIAKGEVRKDIDVDMVASIFTNIKEGYESGIKGENIRNEGNDLYRNACYCLYDLIKK